MNFKIRASAVGQIMSEPQSKAAKERGDLSQTTKSYLENWVKAEKYGRPVSFTSKYTDKGIECEDAAIALYNRFNKSTAEKNTEYKEDDHFTGSCDLYLSEKSLIADIKNSYSFDTHPIFLMQPEKGYLLQGQIYMELWRAKKFEIVRTFVTSPFQILEAELKTASWKCKDNDESYFRAAAEIYRRHTAKKSDRNVFALPPEVISAHKKLIDLSDEICIRVHESEYDANFINSARERVEQCRFWLKKQCY